VDESRKRVIRMRQRPASPGRTADCPATAWLTTPHAALEKSAHALRQGTPAGDQAKIVENDETLCLATIANHLRGAPGPYCGIRFSGWVVPEFHLRLRRFIGMQGAIPESTPDAVAADLRRNVLHPTIVLL
jgi:hypothetical protein